MHTILFVVTSSPLPNVIFFVEGLTIPQAMFVHRSGGLPQMSPDIIKAVLLYK